MVILDQLLQSGIQNMGVDLRRGDIGVTKHFLDNSEISPIGKKVASERVA